MRGTDACQAANPELTAKAVEKSRQEMEQKLQQERASQMPMPYALCASTALAALTTLRVHCVASRPSSFVAGGRPDVTARWQRHRPARRRPAMPPPRLHTTLHYTALHCTTLHYAARHCTDTAVLHY